VVPLEIYPDKNKSLCTYPVLGLIRPVGKCMAMIKPEEVLLNIEKYNNY
jgi:hypothetical protein